MSVKTDRLITLFGGGGFAGRYAAQALFRAGARLRIAEREPRRAFYLKTLCGLGQIQFVRADVRDPAAVAAAVAGADAVVNLVGVLKGDFEGVHVTGSRNVAEAAAAVGVPALVHLSAIGADPDAASDYGRTKGEGEAAVRAAFPNATVLRPSILFGLEDRFVNRLAKLAERLPVIPVFRGGWRLQPLHAADLGKVIAAATLAPGDFAGKTFELGGPQVMTMAELVKWVCKESGRGRAIAEIPDPIGRTIARLTGWLPGAPLSWDQWLMLQQDSVAGAAGMEAFGIRPLPLAAVSEDWFTLYRRHGRFAKVAS